MLNTHEVQVSLVHIENQRVRAQATTIPEVMPGEIFSAHGNDTTEALLNLVRQLYRFRSDSALMSIPKDARELAQELQVLCDRWEKNYGDAMSITSVRSIINPYLGITEAKPKPELEVVLDGEATTAQ